MTSFEEGDRPVIPRSPDHMLTSEELRKQFEVDRPFSEETPAATLGRIAYLNAVATARMVIFMGEIGVPKEFVTPIMEQYANAIRRIHYLVWLGFDSDNDIDASPIETQRSADPVQMHPMQLPYSQTAWRAILATSDNKLARDSTDEELKEAGQQADMEARIGIYERWPGEALAEQIAGLTDEQVLARLEALVDDWPEKRQ